MDEIQRVLIKAGRRDLAQKYYRKVAQPAETYDYQEFTWGDLEADAERALKSVGITEGKASVELIAQGVIVTTRDRKTLTEKDLQRLVRSKTFRGLSPGRGRLILYFAHEGDLR